MQQPPPDRLQEELELFALVLMKPCGCSSELPLINSTSQSHPIATARSPHCCPPGYQSKAPLGPVFTPHRTLYLAQPLPVCPACSSSSSLSCSCRCLLVGQIGPVMWRANVAIVLGWARLLHRNIGFCLKSWSGTAGSPARSIRPGSKLGPASQRTHSY